MDEQSTKISMPENNGNPAVSKSSIFESAKKFCSQAFHLKNRMITIIVFAVIIALAIVGSFINSQSPQKVAIREVKAYIADDKAMLEKQSAYNFKKYVLNTIDEQELYANASEQFDKDIKNWSDYCEAYKAEQLKENRIDFGKYSISVKVVSETDVSLKKFLSDHEWLINDLENKGCFDSSSITAAKEIVVRRTIKGEYAKETGKDTLFMCKIDGKWKVLISVGESLRE